MAPSGEHVPSTRHFVGYHKCANMGALERPGRLLSNVGVGRLEAMLGHTVWVVEGQGTKSPKEFFLAVGQEERRPKRALSIRQPWVELILRGEKTIEYRSRRTHIRDRVYLYAGQRPEESEEAWERVGCAPGELPAGLIVGTVRVTGCREGSDGRFEWLLAEPQRLAAPLEPVGHPQPVWFTPFPEESGAGGREES